MSLFGLKFWLMILHTETSKLMYNWSFLFVVLHKQHSYPFITFKTTIFFSFYFLFWWPFSHVQKFICIAMYILFVQASNEMLGNFITFRPRLSGHQLHVSGNLY